MAKPALSEIENEFARLSTEAQLKLLERLVHRARMTAAERRDDWESQLGAMAADPDIRRELDAISAEFGSAEGDGLKGH